VRGIVGLVVVVLLAGGFAINWIASAVGGPSWSAGQDGREQARVLVCTSDKDGQTFRVTIDARIKDDRWDDACKALHGFISP
jgi:hypothetical protein